MLEVLFEDDNSSGSDVAAASPRQPPAPQHWQVDVTTELQSLHAALEAKARAVSEREAALAAREAHVRRRESQLAKDEAMLRALLDKEAGRLVNDAQVQPVRARPQS